MGESWSKVVLFSVKIAIFHFLTPKKSTLPSFLPTFFTSIPLNFPCSFDWHHWRSSNRRFLKIHLHSEDGWDCIEFCSEPTLRATCQATNDFDHFVRSQSRLSLHSCPFSTLNVLVWPFFDHFPRFKAFVYISRSFDFLTKIVLAKTIPSYRKPFDDLRPSSKGDLGSSKKLKKKSPKWAKLKLLKTGFGIQKLHLFARKNCTGSQKNWTCSQKRQKRTKQKRNCWKIFRGEWKKKKVRSDAEGRRPDAKRAVGPLCASRGLIFDFTRRVESP